MEEGKMIKQTKHGWVDLSNLPTRGKLFDWKNSTGATIKFQYFNEIHTIKIVEYMDSHHVQVSIDKQDLVIANIDNILNGKFGSLLGKKTYDFRYNVGDVVHNNIMITDCYRRNHIKCYSYTCLTDKYSGSITESSILRGRGCPVCAGNKILRGYNDLATLRPDLIDLLWNPEDAYAYGVNSHHKIDFKCPRCGEKNSAYVYNVSARGLCCKKCSDGLSYPSKFVYNFLQQLILPNKFDTEKSFGWAKNIAHQNPKLSGDKLYDFYIRDAHSIVVEVHGSQHFESTFESIGQRARTLLEEQENDKIKMQLALKNNIVSDCYIQLDCRYSNKEHIKSSIMNSNLPSLLDFSEHQIDWDECDKFATSSRVFEACDLWNCGLHSTTKIGAQMKLNQTTILRYLRRGEELGIVQDPPKHKHNKTQQND